MHNMVIIMGIWLILDIVIYGILPDAAKEEQGIGTGIVISFLLSIYFFIHTHFKETFSSIQQQKSFFNFYSFARLIENWILFGLLFYSFLNDSQKGQETWMSILYGGIVAFGFTGGSFFLTGKMKSAIKSKE
jgi:hypothetical protein